MRRQQEGLNHTSQALQVGTLTKLVNFMLGKSVNEEFFVNP